jgi:hypothetical protein
VRLEGRRERREGGRKEKGMDGMKRRKVEGGRKEGGRKEGAEGRNRIVWKVDNEVDRHTRWEKTGSRKHRKGEG